MDYSTVGKKLAADEYTDPIAFAADVRQIYTNAVKYNWMPDHDCHIAARACLRAFEHYYCLMRGVESTAPTGDAHFFASPKPSLNLP